MDIFKKFLIGNKKVNKIGIYALHPIQYQAPIFRALNRFDDVEVTVLYGDNLGMSNDVQQEFGQALVWDVPILDGYRSIFLKNYARDKFSGFFKRVNLTAPIKIFRSNFDVLLIHGHDNFTSIILLVLGKLLSKKVFYRGESFNITQNRSFKVRLKKSILKTILQKCDVVFYSCSGNQEYFKSLGIDDGRLRFLPCSVDNEFFQNKKKELLGSEHDVRSSLGINKEDIVILFSARMVERKRPMELLMAVSSDERLKKTVTCLFVGDGPLLDELKTFSGSMGIKSCFVGFINQSEISKYYLVADIFYIWSSYDASPKALNEAQIFGLPIVASESIGTAYDLVIRPNTGIVAASFEEMVDGIKRLVFDKNLREYLGGNGSSVVADWSSSDSARNLKRTLEGI